MMDHSVEEEELIVVLVTILNNIRIFLALFFQLYNSMRCEQSSSNVAPRKSYSLIDRAPDQRKHMYELVGLSDVTSLDTIRMPRDTFKRLCYLVENLGGLTPTKNVEIAEQVAMFLNILAHHTKNVMIRKSFKRSTWTISKHFHRVLEAVLNLYPVLLVTPQPATTDNVNPRWNFFQGCLGALDGMYIDVRVPRADKPRYRNRKGQVSVNVLAVCDVNMNFVYMLSGWEGSAADSRVLRDAITRPNGLKIPSGNYYLVDNGYTNGPGFLAPYRGVRYHLQDYGSGTTLPQNYKEFFNLKHAKARNVIERAFGILKSRFAILRSHAYYPIEDQNKIIMACGLIHNFIRTTNSHDPEEDNIDEDYVDQGEPPNYEEYIQNVESSVDWTNHRENMAQSMYNEWRASRT